MKKRTIIISGIAGIFILGLCTKFAANSKDTAVIEIAANSRDTAVIEIAANSRDAAAIEIAAVEERVVSDELNKWAGQETTEPESSGEVRPESEKPERMEPQMAQAVKEPERQNKITIPMIVDFVKPIVKLNGEEGILEFVWDNDCIRVDADTLLLVCDCYFSEEKLQQKIFFLAEAPDFTLREVFRQDSKIWEEELKWPECLEWRMGHPHSVDGGYIYELDGILYFLSKDFKEASPLCDLRQLMGDFYFFSPATSDSCDVTADASRMLVCTDEGLYEYNLENGERTLLEPAFFAPYKMSGDDCSCGGDFIFSGPARVEYGPDGKSYAFLIGTEEASWGDISGAVLRSGEGETLYQLYQTETEFVHDFKWVELEDATYFVVFYSQYDGERNYYLMDRVNVNTGEMMTFEVPVEVYWGTDGCVAVGFLDADNLIYFNDSVEVYQLSSGERRNLEVTEEMDWEIMVLDVGGYEAHPVRYPK